MWSLRSPKYSVVCFVMIAVTASARAQQITFQELIGSRNPHLREHASTIAAAVWPSPHLYVCWENPSPQFDDDMMLVRSTIVDTWEKESKLIFTGWEVCASQNQGIRIRIADVGPHTKRLGREINELHDGMVLNFVFKDWSPECQLQHTHCVKAIAVHEFGHAIGFAHEQNRFDAPGECQLLRQGVDGPLLLTPYDPVSVMNYCNKEFYNSAKLSELDIAAVRRLYGKP